jgi:hypothetical protein
VRPLAVFQLDRETIELPAWEGARGERIAQDASYGVFYRVAGRCVEILAPRNRPPVRTALMRVVRELAMQRAWSARSFLLHAAAFAREGRGFLVAGPKESGKTTLLLHALRGRGTSFVANDRLRVALEDGGVHIRAMPSILSIRDGSFGFFPALRDGIVSRRFHYRRSVEETGRADAPEAEVWPGGRFGISAAQLCALVEQPAAAGARAAVLLLPRVTGAAGGIRLRRLSAEEGAAGLRGSIFGGARGGRSALFADAGDTPLPDSPSTWCTSTAASLACFDCALGKDAYACEATLWEALGDAAA